MNEIDLKPKSALPTVLLWSIVFLFFFQLLTEFVEGIYLYGLLGTEIPPEIGLIALFFAPFVWALFRKHPPITLVKLLGSAGLAARTIEIFLPTRGRMIVSGLGMMSLLLFLPAALSLSRAKQEQHSFARQLGAGLSLAVIAHILLRALHSGSDLSAYAGFRLISVVLALAGILLLWRSSLEEPASRQETAPAKRMRVIGHTLGLAGVLVVLYFAIIAPHVAARWAGAPQLSVFATVLGSWVLGGWWLMHSKGSNTALLLFGAGFVLMMMLAILPHQINFPSGPDTGYPLLALGTSYLQVLPLYLMLALSPVLAVIFFHHLDKILEQQPKIGLLGVSFGLGGVFMMLMVLSQVFTTVYDYIPVIGPFFRDKYWLAFLVPGVVAVLPLLAGSVAGNEAGPLPTSARSLWLLAAGSLAVTALAGIALLSADPSPPVGAPDTLRVFTYNIQQGYNDFGERNFDGQAALVKSADPDIVGLQESDTARIAGGNADVVGYFADRLEMYSYYGPSPVTGTFGIALLSKYPIQNPQTYFVYSEGEQVAVIEADITVGETTFKVYVTHLGNRGPIIQIRQMLEIMRGEENVIAMGDFNFRPYEEQYAITVAEYDDAFVLAKEKAAPNTWGASEEFEIEERIDHIFVSAGIPVLFAEYFTQNESDHPGFFVELGLGE